MARREFTIDGILFLAEGDDIPAYRFFKSLRCKHSSVVKFNTIGVGNHEIKICKDCGSIVGFKTLAHAEPYKSGDDPRITARTFGATFKHNFTDNVYVFMDVVTNEYDLEYLVVYAPISDRSKKFVRPINEFFSKFTEILPEE